MPHKSVAILNNKNTKLKLKNNKFMDKFKKCIQWFWGSSNSKFQKLQIKMKRIGLSVKPFKKQNKMKIVKLKDS